MFGKRVKKTHGFHRVQRFADLKAKVEFILPIIGRENIAYDEYFYKKDAYDEKLFIENNYFIDINQRATDGIKHYTSERRLYHYGFDREIDSINDFQDISIKLFPDYYFDL